MAEVKQPRTGTPLIEDEGSHARLSWMAGTKEVKQKDSLYNHIIFALQREMWRTENKSSQTASAHLFELTPRQGWLTTDSKDLSLSPHNLVKALYPAIHQLEESALQQFWQ